MLIYNHNIYENVRTRAIVLHQGRLLLLSPIEPGDWWCPPGGGLEPNESLSECIIREVYEETGLEVTVAGMAFLREWIVPKYCSQPDPSEYADQVGFGLEVFFYAIPISTEPQPRLESPTSKLPVWIPLAEVAQLQPFWPKELKALALRLTAGEKAESIVSFIGESDNAGGEVEMISFGFEIDKNGDFHQRG